MSIINMKKKTWIPTGFEVKESLSPHDFIVQCSVKSRIHCEVCNLFFSRQTVTDDYCPNCDYELKTHGSYARYHEEIDSQFLQSLKEKEIPHTIPIIKTGIYKQVDWAIFNCDYPSYHVPDSLEGKLLYLQCLADSMYHIRKADISEPLHIVGIAGKSQPYFIWTLGSQSDDELFYNQIQQLFPNTDALLLPPPIRRIVLSPPLTLENIFSIMMSYSLDTAYDVAFVLDTDQGKRDYQEDAASALSFSAETPRGSQEYSIGVICDGHGGEANGDLASTIGIQTSTQCAMHLQTGTEQNITIEDSLRQAITVVNESIINANHHEEKMGTTLALCILEGNCNLAHIAWAGDSPVFFIDRTIGHIQQVTRDHTVRHAKEDNGEPIDENDYRLNYLTSSLGSSSDELIIGYKNIRVDEHDLILLTSDGLTETLTPEDILNVIAQNPIPVEATQALVEIALEREASDNLSIVMMELIQKENEQ